jgi:hypothetical protein
MGRAGAMLIDTDTTLTEHQVTSAVVDLGERTVSISMRAAATPVTT